MLRAILASLQFVTGMVIGIWGAANLDWRTSLLGLTFALSVAAHIRLDRDKL